jgi:lysine 2,3-aminomutase
MPPQKSLRSVSDLIAAGLVPEASRADVEPVATRYAIALTPEVAALALHEPAMAAQFVPSAHETTTLPEERADPIGDAAHSPVKGIVHRYRDRVLLKLTHVCPVYCRFCFRREMVGPAGQGALDGAELEAAIGYIAANPAIFEVIVTGGDPFILSARRIAEVTARIGRIPHVRALRWHTRVPMVQPGAVTPALVKALRAPGLATYVAIHANHPAEFTPAACRAIAALADGGIALLSQTVLLNGVNAEVETLEALMRAFVANRIKPYYLHHPDLAPGTAHFRLSFDAGLALMDGLCQRLSGIALPRYVIDIPGGYGKVPVQEARLIDGQWYVRDLAGRAHRYP